MTSHRSLLARAALLVVALAASASALAQNTVLRVVPHSNLAILDPIWTTAYMSRNHGYMIYDTLFGTDENAKIKPQMVESWTESADNRLWTFKLRKGLEFHDGKPVTGEDVIASLQRWGKRDAMGSALMTFVAAHGHADARHLPHLPRRGLRLRPRGARQAVVERALHHAQAHRRDRCVQADRGAHRLGPVHLQARRVQAGRQGGLPQERQVRAAQRAALGQHRRQARLRRPGRVEPRPARRAGAGQRAARTARSTSSRRSAFDHYETVKADSHPADPEVREATGCSTWRASTT